MRSILCDRVVGLRFRVLVWVRVRVGVRVGVGVKVGVRVGVKDQGQGKS
jgi:hypothetical protein